MRKAFYKKTNELITDDEMLKTMMVARSGFEPEQTDPESVVLPLHHRAKRTTYINTFIKILYREQGSEEKNCNGSVTRGSAVVIFCNNFLFFVDKYVCIMVYIRT